MALSLETRRVGDIAIVTCTGRIVEGAETAALQRCLTDLLAFGANIVLNVGGVDFVDSSGLGLLMRFLNRAQTARGNLKLCGANAQLREVLRITKLDTLLEVHESEADTVADFYQRLRSDPDARGFQTDILCVERSPDVLAYVRELLRHSGFGVLSASNLPDAVTLLRATRPRVVVISAEYRAMHATAAADQFNHLADSLPVVELPEGFSTDDPAAAGAQLVQRVHALLTGV